MLIQVFIYVLKKRFHAYAAAVVPVPFIGAAQPFFKGSQPGHELLLSAYVKDVAVVAEGEIIGLGVPPFGDRDKFRRSAGGGIA